MAVALFSILFFAFKCFWRAKFYDGKTPVQSAFNNEWVKSEDLSTWTKLATMDLTYHTKAFDAGGISKDQVNEFFCSEILIHVCEKDTPHNSTQHTPLIALV